MLICLLLPLPLSPHTPRSQPHSDRHLTPPTHAALFHSNTHNINILSLSRVFLFASRDLWFEVPLPFFLRDAASGIGWDRALVGAFLAVSVWPPGVTCGASRNGSVCFYRALCLLASVDSALHRHRPCSQMCAVNPPHTPTPRVPTPQPALQIFIIVYGQVQSWTPQLVLQPLNSAPPDKYVATYWCLTLALPTAVLGARGLGQLGWSRRLCVGGGGTGCVLCV
jgi:hypothetical protein